MYLSEFKGKTWIDWIKILVAVDIAGAGIGLILNVDMHVFAYLLRVIGLGFLSRIFFGILYVFVAVLIFKRIFPQKLATEEHTEAKKMDEEIMDTTNAVKKGVKKLAQQAVVLTDKVHEKLDTLIDRGEQVFEKGKKDINQEVKKLIDE